MENNIVQLINMAYGTDKGGSDYIEVRGIICSEFDEDDLLNAVRFTRLFIKQLAPVGALSGISLTDMANKLKLILGEFETDIYGKYDAVHFIHRLLLRQIREWNDGEARI